MQNDIEVQNSHLTDSPVYVDIDFREVVDSRSGSIKVGVWVENSDSRKELHDRALAKALQLMEAALAAQRR